MLDEFLWWSGVVACSAVMITAIAAVIERKPWRRSVDYRAVTERAICQDTLKIEDCSITEDDLAPMASPPMRIRS